MGAGGEATRRWASRRADVRAEAPHDAGGKSDLRRGTRGAFARGRRQTSYEKLHELADWKRIGLHDKYADATMVRDARARKRRAREATTRHTPIGSESPDSARGKPSASRAFSIHTLFFFFFFWRRGRSFATFRAPSDGLTSHPLLTHLFCLSLSVFRNVSRTLRSTMSMQSRPMTRGWLHIGIAAIATCLVASDGGRDYLKIRHEKSLVTFFLVTFVFPYWASTLLHFVPWKRRVAHDVALVLDFLGIASGFAGQTVAWCGERWWALVDVDATDETNGKVKINPDRVAAVAAVAATCILAYILTVAVLRRNRVPVMLHRRTARFAITGFNMLMLGIVETRNVRSVPLNVLLQLVGKIFVPGYFVLCVAVDATRKGPLPLWPGVWSAHENWHVVILILHVMQFYAISLKTHGEGFKWEWPE